MADSQLKRKIYDVLTEAYFSDRNDLVDVSDGDDDETIHLVIVSRKFDPLNIRQKNDLIWSLLESKLSQDEWGKVTLTVGASPEEVKAV